MSTLSKVTPFRLRALGRAFTLPFAVLVLSGCTGEVGAGDMGAPGGPPGSSGNGSMPNGSGGANSYAGGASVDGDGNGIPGTGGNGSTVSSCVPGQVKPGLAPLRRLTRFEYNNTVRDILKDASLPANSLPSEELGNGFGNDAKALSVSSLLAEQWGTVAEGIAQRATATPAQLGLLAACGSTVTAANEEACARSIIESWVPKAYRRALVAGEADELLTLYRAARGTAGATFSTGVATVIQAVLQAPDFLYRIEWGAPDPTNPALRRPTGDEMATRLSYFLWGSSPDDGLRAAAASGQLSTKEGVLAQAQRMLADDRAKLVVRFFFDNLLPISGLTGLERDKAQYPTFSASIGNLMHQETQKLLEYEVFEGSGTWTGALVAPYTFVNQTLATYYGMSGVTGDTFQKVPLDTTKRLGVLLQGGFMAGTTHANFTNPVVRGAFVMKQLLCTPVPLPSPDLADKIKPPDPTSGKTGRERYSQHSQDPVCKTCHSFMDPIGFTFENFDAVGRYRETENGVAIDASGSLPGTEGTVTNAVGLVEKLATAEAVQTCFATHWAEFAYGITFGAEDACTKETVHAAVKRNGSNVKQLLLDLTQTDAFLYLPAR